MANTYSQIHPQLIFAVKHREALIKNEWKDEIEKYICGIITHNRCKPLAIYCNPDHTPIFLGFCPSVLISDLVGSISLIDASFRVVQDCATNAALFFFRTFVPWVKTPRLPR
jgi:REP element-mobilizing transposase RayT